MYFILGTCWGSFLNVIAHRLLYETPFFAPRSQCPHCEHGIAWYDLIPIISWIYLSGRCRSCKNGIHWLYPCIELITGLATLGVMTCVPSSYYVAYGVCLSSLIVTIRTDIEDLSILHMTTIPIIPIMWVCSAFGYLPISLFESITASIASGSIFWSIHILYRFIRGLDGMGAGDIILISQIGAFIGFIGLWFAIMLGSILTAITGFIAMTIYKKTHRIQLPFGAFLAAAALASSIYFNTLNDLFFTLFLDTALF